MGVSQKRREQRAKRKAQREARLKNPGKDSKYARKVRGIYPPRSPYLTGDWGPRLKIDNFFEPRVIETLNCPTCGSGETCSWDGFGARRCFACERLYWPQRAAIEVQP